METFTEIKKIAKLLKRSFDETPWYGPSVSEVLKDITPEMANHRLPDSHSIVELLQHMTTWRNFVTNQVNGNVHEVSEEENFPKAISWKDAVAQLNQSQLALMQALNNFPEERLNEKVPLREYRFHFMLYGIIQHDIYHLGQISLLKKLRS